MAEPTQGDSTTRDNTPENTTSWRDLADQLTPEQVTKLQEIERDPVGYFVHIGLPMSRCDVQATLLRMARSYAGDNLAGALYAEVPDPAGAVYVSDWSDWDVDAACRYFTGSARVVKRDDRNVSVRIDGTQYPDGRADRLIGVAEGDYERLSELTSITARELGQALIAAADEVDRWAEAAEGTKPAK